jgi:hypothetical protein
MKVTDLMFINTWVMIPVTQFPFLDNEQQEGSSTKEPKTHDGEKTASSTNAGGKTGYPHVED